MIDAAPIRHFDQLVRQDPELRRAYLAMLEERRTALIESGFHGAKTIEQLENFRGQVSMLTTLANSHEKERSHAVARAAATAG